jgi:hypothetical protein
MALYLHENITTGDRGAEIVTGIIIAFATWEKFLLLP